MPVEQNPQQGARCGQCLLVTETHFCHVIFMSCWITFYRVAMSNFCLHHAVWRKRTRLYTVWLSRSPACVSCYGFVCGMCKGWKSICGATGELMSNVSEPGFVVVVVVGFLIIIIFIFSIGYIHMHLPPSRWTVVLVFISFVALLSWCFCSVFIPVQHIPALIKPRKACSRT